MIKRSLSQIRTDSRDALAGNYSVCFIALFFMFITDIAISQIMYLLPLRGAPGVFVILTDVIYSIPGSLIMTMLQAGFLFLCLNHCCFRFLYRTVCTASCQKTQSRSHDQYASSHLFSPTGCLFQDLLTCLRILPDILPALSVPASLP